MTGVTSVKVKESLETLSQQLKQVQEPIQKEKLQVLYSLKQDSPLKINQISVLLGRHRSTIQRWVQVYCNQGLEGLLKPRGKSSGAKRKIPLWAERTLAKRLTQSNHGFKSYGEIQKWLDEKLSVKAEYKTVHYMVRYRLGTRLKAVRSQNVKQDQQQLPALKKPRSRSPINR